MIKLNVYIEIKGEQVKVGEIIGSGSDSCVFRYSDEYMMSSSGRPISISLPFRDKAFSPENTRNFFSGLLPEGFMRRRVSELVHVSPDDYVEILRDLGNECIGAIRILEDGEDPLESQYVKLGEDEIALLAGEGVVEASELVMKAHLSLTGASGKVGLYMDPESREWLLPLGEAPSTHIIKQSHIRLGGIVTNEQLCLRTASRLGISVPESFIIGMDDNSDAKVLLATSRYDRIMAEHNRKISGHTKPDRLHQEDLCQVMGLPSSEKYEDPDGQYIARIFKEILNHSARPVEDQIRLWDMIVFDYLTGNTDNHLKNLSFLYSDDLRSIRLAPAYDMLSTSIYEMSTLNMAMNIGGDISLPDITRDSFKRAAEDAGIGTAIAMKRFDKMVRNYKSAIGDAAQELARKGFSNASEIRDRILETGGISHV